MFGQAVELNINGKNTHKTLIGGIMSIVIKMFCLLYVISMLMKFSNHKDDRIHSYSFYD